MRKNDWCQRCELCPPSLYDPRVGQYLCFACRDDLDSGATEDQAATEVVVALAQAPRLQEEVAILSYHQVQ